MEIYTANTKNEINDTKKNPLEYNFHAINSIVLTSGCIVKKIKVRISKRIALLNSSRNYFISQNMNWWVMGKEVIV